VTAKAIFLVLTILAPLGIIKAYDIYHIPPAHFIQGVPGQLEVVLPDYLDPDFVKLFIRDQDRAIYEELSFYEDAGAWYCDIPAAYMRGDTLYYYIGASFGPAGLAAFPAEDPDVFPLGIPLIKFITTKRKFEPQLTQEVIVDYRVTPWKPKPARRSNNFPVLYVPQATQAFIESGHIKIIGNEKATSEDLLRSMLYLCLQENADAITELKYELLTAKEGLEKLEGHIELEGIYLRRPPRK